MNRTIAQEFKTGKINFKELEYALSDPEVIEYAVKLRLQSYARCGKKRQEELDGIIRSSLAILKKGLADLENFDKYLYDIIIKNFKKHEPEFWFNYFENNYRNNIRIEIELDYIREYLQGNKILDLGCGTGRISTTLSKENYKCTLADVIDYRSDEEKKLPFIQITNSTDLAKIQDKFDTTLVFFVFHHLPDKDLFEILKHLKRISKRIIIKEDVFGLNKSMFNLDWVKRQESFNGFINFDPEKQRKILILNDYISNVFLQGIPEINFPFNFHSYSNWGDILEQNGFKIVKRHIEGIRRDDSEYYGSCHAYFIADTR